jgi:hypothetical protein
MQLAKTIMKHQDSKGNTYYPGNIYAVEDYRFKLLQRRGIVGNVTVTEEKNDKTAASRKTKVVTPAKNKRKRKGGRK